MLTEIFTSLVNFHSSLAMLDLDCIRWLNSIFYMEFLKHVEEEANLVDDLLTRRMRELLIRKCNEKCFLLPKLQTFAENYPG